MRAAPVIDDNSYAEGFGDGWRKAGLERLTDRGARAGAWWLGMLGVALAAPAATERAALVALSFRDEDYRRVADSIRSSYGDG